MLDRRDFVAELVHVMPEAEPTVAEHLGDYDGDLLLHLLLPDRLRLAVAAFGRGDRDLTKRFGCVIARGLEEGDEYVTTAIAVSFVEHFGAGSGETDDLLALWPPALRKALRR